jgi:hypothetical protein
LTATVQVDPVLSLQNDGRDGEQGESVGNLSLVGTRGSGPPCCRHAVPAGRPNSGDLCCRM